jgi:hypothetical protein
MLGIVQQWIHCIKPQVLFTQDFIFHSSWHLVRALNSTVVRSSYFEAVVNLREEILLVSGREPEFKWVHPSVPFTPSPPPLRPLTFDSLLHDAVEICLLIVTDLI